ISVSLQKLVDAGIPVFKLQEAAAIYVSQVTEQAIDVLHRYAQTIYLTQTLEKKDGKFTMFLNLEDAFAAWKSNPGPREWRTHIHVPVFLDDLGPFRTTRFAFEVSLRFYNANHFPHDVRTSNQRHSLVERVTAAHSLASHTAVGAYRQALG